MTHKIKKNILDGVTHLILIIIAITTLFPFYWMLKTAFTTDTVALQVPPELITFPLYFGNFPKVFELMPMWKATWNSVFIAVVSTVGVLTTCSMAGFAFAKIRFKGSKVIFGVLLATMLIPSQVTLIPLFMVFSSMHWVDTHLPLIVPQIMINAYGIFLLKQFMMGIPDSYIEAAKIDGARYGYIYAKIMLPLCKPSLVTLGLFTFVGNWNNFLGPLIFLSDERKFTLPLIINSFRTIYLVNWGLLMAAATVSIIPILIIYLFAQKSFVNGIALTGLKS